MALAVTRIMVLALTGAAGATVVVEKLNTGGPGEVAVGGMLAVTAKTFSGRATVTAQGEDRLGRRRRGGYPQGGLEMDPAGCVKRIRGQVEYPQNTGPLQAQDLILDG